MIEQTKSSEPDVPEPIDPQCASLLDRIRIDCANRFPPLGDRALTQFKAKMRAYQANEIQSRIKAIAIPANRNHHHARKTARDI